MNVLVIGGTRNLGPSIVQALLEAGYQVTVLHRGVTAAKLPDGVQILHADRSDAEQLRRAVERVEVDAVVDTTLYNGPDAKNAVQLFAGRISRYVFLSTGQVYLLRKNVTRPFREEDYAGPTMAEPPVEDEFNHSNWAYGFHKREAEDVFDTAAAEGFPVTTLRLPMVNSERDHYDRIYGYLRRMWDGGPLLVPADEGLPIRHIYGADVVRAVLLSLQTAPPAGRAFNIAQDETLSLAQFLQRLSEYAGSHAPVLRIPRKQLEASGLLLYASPFSEPWMSSLDNTRSKSELGMTYTPVAEYLPRLVEHYRSRATEPLGYAQRKKELEFAKAWRPM